MHTRSQGRKDTLQHIEEIEAFARRNKSNQRQEQAIIRGEPSSSHYSNSPRTEVQETLAMADDGNPNNEERPPAPPRRVLVGDYVQPYGAIRNQSAIVLSPEAQSLDIRPYWFTFIATNQFAEKLMRILTHS